MNTHDHGDAHEATEEVDNVDKENAADTRSETAGTDVDVHAPTGPIAVPNEDGELEKLAPIRLVEAALFTAGRPLGIDEIVDATGLGKREVDRAVKSLAMEYTDLGDKSAMEVGMAGDKWAMQLKTKYVEHAQKLANMEIPKKVLKTLALIAFHQPILQSELVDMVGSKTYDHVREIHEHGLIKLKQEGLSKRIVTSAIFPEYFGIPATDTEKIRTYLANKVGLQLRPPGGEARLSEYAEGKTAATDDEGEKIEVAESDDGIDDTASVPDGENDTARDAPEEITVDDEDPRLSTMEPVDTEATA